MAQEVTTLGEALTKITRCRGDLTLFVRDEALGEWNSDTPAALLKADPYEESDEPPPIAKKHNLIGTLHVDDLKGIIDNLRAQTSKPTLEQIVRAFLYYWDCDAFIDLDNCNETEIIEAPKTDCPCEAIPALEFSIESLRRVVKASKRASAGLSKVAEESRWILSSCPHCGQMYQQAWDSPREGICFKVPPIPMTDWLQEQYISPGQVIAVIDRIADWVKRVIPEEKEELCNRENCNRRAIKGSLSCTVHSIEREQNAGRMPEFPRGRAHGAFREMSLDEILAVVRAEQ